MATYEELKKKIEPFIKTVVLDGAMQLALLHGMVVDSPDAEDYYYDMEDCDGRRVHFSCVAGMIGLKGRLSEEDYNHIERDYYFQRERILEEKRKISEEKADDLVNHPKHYTQGQIEVLDVIEDWKLDYKEGNIVKYVARYKHKNGLQDLKKAQFYLSRLILQIEKEGTSIPND